MLTALQTPTETEAQSILDMMLKESKSIHTVTTSDRVNWRRHNEFKGVVRELRKKGLKVTSKDEWSQTNWRISM